MQLVEETLYDFGPVGSGVQAELPGGTQTVLVHLPREDEGMLHQRHHPQAVALHRHPRPPASPGFPVPLAVPSPHAGPQTLTRASPEASHQTQDPPLQLQPASGPLAHGHPRRLAQSASLQAPHVEELRGQDPGEVRIHLDQTRGTREGGV